MWCYSWLSTWTTSEITKTQIFGGTHLWGIFFLIKSFEYERSVSNLSFEVGWFTFPGSQTALAFYLKNLEENLLSLLVAVSGKSIPSLALEPTSLRSQHMLKRSLDIRPHGLNNSWFWRSSFGRQSFLD